MSDNKKTQLDHIRKKAKNLSVLYADDEADMRTKGAKFFDRVFKTTDVASNGKEALDKYLKGQYDIVITDILMPKMDGLELIAEIRKKNKQQEIIITSAFTELSYLTKAIELGVTGYIVKPISYDNILNTIEQSIDKLRMISENEIYRTKLEERVEKRTKKIVKLQKEQISNFIGVINLLAKIIDRKDSYTGGHSERVAIYSKAIAQALGVAPDKCDLIYQAGLLHDIGKIIIPDSILLKPGKLTKNEYKLIQEHVTTGYEIISEIPMYKEIADIIFSHHELYGGGGYPRSQKGEEIPLFSRIMTIADTFDAMTTNRIYKTKKNKDVAMKELKTLSGSWYDPNIIDVAIDVLDKVDIDALISQYPQSDIDDDRFAYFYKDPLTNLHNQNYLDYILYQNSLKDSFLCLNIIYVKNFGAYNKKNGWSSGDIFLTSFASYLVSQFPNSEIYRIFGDDFLIADTTHQDIDIDKINSSELLVKSGITCGLKHLDRQKEDIDSYRDLQEIL